MNNKIDLGLILEQFIEDLETGTTPQIYDLMEVDPEIVEELYPLLELLTLIEASEPEMPQVQSKVISSSSEWSMQRLIEAGDPTVVAQVANVGLNSEQLAALRSDTTPFNINEPVGVTIQLAKKYGVHMAGFMNWVNQLISGVLHSQASVRESAIYARETKTEEPNRSSSQGK